MKAPSSAISMNEDKARELLRSVRQYVEAVHNEAEARHDNPDGDYYDDFRQYEIMQTTDAILKEIDDLLLD